ncbi:hypothetical protein ACIBG7_41660 [Nonomuraea sp. NPDC050328]|uniref:hypothetical protein n=1 Tax=Nonomuraea sp. NPDC050328 TaxID=3364361 RepID=UPI00379F958D
MDERGDGFSALVLTHIAASRDDVDGLLAAAGSAGGQVTGEALRRALHRPRRLPLANRHISLTAVPAARLMNSGVQAVPVWIAVTYLTAWSWSAASITQWTELTGVWR